MRRARKQLGKSQRDIAVEVGRTQPTVFSWESDLSSPETTLVRTVARAYCLHPERILPDDPLPLPRRRSRTRAHGPQPASAPR